jgi:hypothetical protein
VKQPVDHIARSPLPWVANMGLTECGLPAASYPTITRLAYLERLKDMGEQRASLFTCMTCKDTVGHWKTWDEDPVSAIQRETGYMHGRAPRKEEFRLELLAIAALIEAHRDEFDSYIAGLQAVVKLDEHRQAKPKISRTSRWSKW